MLKGSVGFTWHFYVVQMCPSGVFGRRQGTQSFVFRSRGDAHQHKRQESTVALRGVVSGGRKLVTALRLGGAWDGKRSRRPEVQSGEMDPDPRASKRQQYVDQTAEGVEIRAWSFEIMRAAENGLV